MISSLILQADIVKPPETNIAINSVKFLTPSSIVIDGNLSSNEWDTAEHITQWYLDADPENYDGFNYMYITEDLDNLYIGLDLVSDQTNDEAGEWVGIWLNTNETVVEDDPWANGNNLWYDALNNGMESLLFDVDNNQEMPFLQPPEFDSVQASSIKSLNELFSFDGTFEGTADDFIAKWDDKSANVTSVYNGTDYIYRLDIEISLSNYYDIFADLFSNNTLSVSLRSQHSTNVTINEHYVTIRDSLGNLLLNNPNQTLPIYTGTSTIMGSIITALPGNFTQDNRVFFSYVGIHDAPFKAIFDRLFIEFTRPRTTFIADGYVQYPYSSIKNYEIAWSFAGSENNATAHRIFELKIPKSELEGYTQDSDFGIIIGGYGTLISFPNTHSWVFANGTDTGMPYTFSSQYNYYTMPMKGWTPLDNPVLASIDPKPSISGDITLNWNTDPNVANWTVVRYNSTITDFNIDDVDILGTGLTINQYIDTGISNGTYWYAVVAIDSLGYAYLSNVVSVTVEIPSTTSSSTTSSSSGSSSSSTIDSSSTTKTSSQSSSTTSSSASISTSSTSTSDEGSSPGLSITLSVIALFVILIYHRRRI